MSRRRTDRIVARGSIAGVIGACALFGGCSVQERITPPIVYFENHSGATLHVRYWTGRSDIDAPYGITDWRSPVKLTLAPGDRAMNGVGRWHWMTANTDAVVRLQIETEGEGYEDGRLMWYELRAPSPYRVVAMGSGGDLLLESRTEGALASVPREQWIPGNLDDLPVWGDVSWEPAPPRYVLPEDDADTQEEQPAS